MSLDDRVFPNMKEYVVAAITIRHIFLITK